MSNKKLIRLLVSVAVVTLTILLSWLAEKVCPKCGEKASDDYRPLATKYPDGMQV